MPTVFVSSVAAGEHEPRPRRVLEFAKVRRVFGGGVGVGLAESATVYCLENAFVSRRLCM